MCDLWDMTNVRVNPQYCSNPAGDNLFALFVRYLRKHTIVFVASFLSATWFVEQMYSTLVVETVPLIETMIQLTQGFRMTLFVPTTIS